MEDTKMRGKMSVLILGVLLLWCGGLVQADYLNIYNDTIIDTDLDAIVTVHNSAEVTVLPGGGAGIFYLTDTSSALVYGGHASYDANDSSVLDLYGGTFGSVRYTGSLAKIYVHGKNFDYEPGSSSVFLSGNWLDGTEFNIYFRGLPEPFGDALGTNIFLVPEPTTISLLLLGSVVVRKLRF